MQPGSKSCSPIFVGPRQLHASMLAREEWECHSDAQQFCIKGWTVCCQHAGLIPLALSGCSHPVTACGVCSCAGVVIYGFMCLFASVAVPLYCAWAWEQGAQQRWLQQVAPGGSSTSGDSSEGGTRPTAAPGHPLQPSNSPEHQQQHAVQEAHSAPAMHSTGSSSSLSSSSDGSGGSSGVMTRLEAICLRAEAVATEQECAFGKQLPILNGLVLHPSFCIRWCAHLSVLFVLALLCWLVSNGVALVLLPKLLDSRQLQRWCPNRPYTPYLIAGDVYEGL